MSYEKIKTESYQLSGGINNKASPYNNGPHELRDIINMQFSQPGSLDKRPGTSLYVGATIQGRITGGVEFQRLSGSSYFVVTANTNAYSVSGSFNVIKTNLLSNALFDFVTFVDRLFCANGQDFFKYDGTNTTAYSLPAGQSGWGLTGIVGGGLSGVFVASWGFINDRGYFGPSTDGITISLNGSTFGTIGYVGLTSPTGFGISAIQLYRSSPGGIDLFGTTTTLSSSVTENDTGFPLTNLVTNENLYFTMSPRYMEIYNNQLFMAGFSSQLSTIYWSQIGEPEGIDPSFNAEFRTNDGDRVTALKTYNGSLIVTKERSFHRVTGDNPSDFALQEISDQYGCVSNRGTVVFENKLWFLDPKGICEYDGASVRIVSNKVEDIFKRMNLNAARDNAVAMHNREQNQVWFSFPIDGASYNNATVIYDYLTDAWSRFEGLQVSSLWLAKGTIPQRSPIVGGYTGTLAFFGSTFTSDIGNAITCAIKTPYLYEAGQTFEKQWRRFYLNLDPISGSSQPITVNFRTNYGEGVSLTRVMYQAPFQSRIDFGLPSRSIQAEIIHSSATLSIRVYGYTFESRFQRRV